MIPVLIGKHVVLGVTGSIACYKALDLASKLTQAGALVEVIMTHAASQFVTPLAFRSVTHRQVTTSLSHPQSEHSIEHVALAEKADVVIVAPATAHCIAKAALGLADDPLTTTLLATQAPIIIAPAMDGHMYQNPATQHNLEKLHARGMTIVGPDNGRLASGITGIGRLIETKQLIGHVRAILGRNGYLSNKTIVVSAGGTQEHIDPARMITNRSSGKMGYALAEAARDQGARTILISAPTSLSDPVGVQVIKIGTALEMQHQVNQVVNKAQALIMAAAVSDYRPKTTANRKLKKDSTSIAIELVKNPDILAETKGSMVKVGFAAESNDLIENAKLKLVQKDLDLIVANDITTPNGGFGTDTNKVVIISKNGVEENLPIMSKESVAYQILDRVRMLLDTISPC